MVSIKQQLTASQGNYFLEEITDKKSKRCFLRKNWIIMKKHNK